MRRKLMAACVTTCMICLLAGCGNNENQVADGTISATNNEKTVISKKVQTTSEQKQNQKADYDNKKLEVEEEYKNLPESEGFVFESNGDGTCVLKEIGLCNDTDIVIPEKSPEGDMVTEIADYAFYDAKDISRIIFAGRNLKIDDDAFQTCEAEQLIISGCELTVGGNAFSYCDDINNILISNSSVDVDEYAFYDCGKNMEVVIHNVTGTLDDDSFQACGVLNLNIEDSSLEIGDNAFSYCDDLETLAVTDSTVDIGSYAFYDTGKDTAITFTDSIIEMDDDAFESCGAMTLSFSGSDTILGDNAFAYCEDLTDLTIGANHTEIGSYAFYDCSALNSISIAAESEDNDLEIVIKDDAFASCAVQNAVIGCASVNLGDGAFSYCEKLVRVELKGNITKGGHDVFFGCPDELAIMYKGNSYNKLSIEDVM